MLKQSLLGIIVFLSSISFANDSEGKKLESHDAEQETSIFLMNEEINNPSETDHNKTDTTESNCSNKMVLRDGTIIECSIIKEEDDRIFYKKCSDKLGRKFAKKKEFISKIIYEDGKEVDYSAHEISPDLMQERNKSYVKAGARAVGIMLIALVVVCGLIVGVILIIGNTVGFW